MATNIDMRAVLDFSLAGMSFVADMKTRRLASGSKITKKRIVN